jgi:DNA-binding beta-propeller fold protein YncE
MVRGLFRVLAVAVFAMSAAASGQVWPPQLVTSFPAPPGAIDVAYEEGPLYALVGSAPPTVFTLNYWNGSITGSFTIPVPNGARGIATTGYSPTHMWVSNRLNGYLYRLTTSGSLLGSFACPGGTPYGLGGYRFAYPPDEGYLMVSCRDENHFLRVNHTTGSLVSSFAGPATAVIGYDEWLAVDRNNSYLYWNYYGSWRVLDTLPARPWGIATNVMWTIGTGIRAYALCRDGYIYHYSGYTAVAPASVGRVKALFR